MSGISDALAALADRLVSLAAEDAGLRSQLRELAEAVLRATEQPKEDVERLQPELSLHEAAVELRQSISIAGDGASVVAAETAPSAEIHVGPIVALPELTLGRSVPQAETAAPSYPAHWTPKPETEFPLIEARCRLKAEGARWAASRRRLVAEGAPFATDIAPKDREIISRAKELSDCYLWMCHPSGPSPQDLRLYEQVAGGFDCLADIVSVVRQIQDEPDLYQGTFEKALDLAAEAQSALRVAIENIDGPADTDQFQVFRWLKATANENQIFIRRFMRIDDSGAPSLWEDLASRIEEVDSSMQEARSKLKKRRKLLGKVRHKASLIADETGNLDEHWRILTTTVEELVSDGLPPSNRELRELLIPVIESMPEEQEISKGFQLALRELDLFLATCPPQERESVSQRSPDVQRVAKLLSGKSVVLIGGDRRASSHAALLEAFGLSELIWISTREHQSIESFEPYVARPEVAVVLLAIRWSSHSYGEVGGYCEKYGKPLVRLPGGYNPNQVAAQILGQCSDRLAMK